jgi:hypothetical protein
MLPETLSDNLTMAMKADRLSGFFAYIFSWPVLKKNLVIALLVGILLSLANQLDVLLREPWTPRLGLKIFFNFLIPFGVSSASAWVNRQTS